MNEIERKKAMKGFQQLAFYARQEEVREIQHIFDSGCRLEAANRLAELDNLSISDAIERLIELCN